MLFENVIVNERCSMDHLRDHSQLRMLLISYEVGMGCSTYARRVASRERAKVGRGCRPISAKPAALTEQQHQHGPEGFPLPLHELARRHRQHLVRRQRARGASTFRRQHLLQAALDELELLVHELVRVGAGRGGRVARDGRGEHGHGRARHRRVVRREHRRAVAGGGAEEEQEQCSPHGEISRNLLAAQATGSPDHLNHLLVQ